MTNLFRLRFTGRPPRRARLRHRSRPPGVAGPFCPRRDLSRRGFLPPTGGVPTGWHRRELGGPAVLYVFGFQRTAVVLSDLYFVDPDPKFEGQESPEHGVRLEPRRIRLVPPQGHIYAAR